MTYPVKDRSGEVYGKLTVMRDTGERQHGNVVWECLCECGRTKRVSANNLESGNTQSCGYRANPLSNIELRDGQVWMLPKGRKVARTVHEAGPVLVDYADSRGVRESRTVREFKVWVHRYSAKVA